MGRPKTMRVVRPVVLSSEQQEMLEARARARSAPARIVLLAGAGLQDQQIAARLKITPEKAARWRNRFWMAVFRRWIRMRRPGKNSHDHASQDPRGDPKNHAGEAQQRNPLEYAQHG